MTLVVGKIDTLLKTIWHYLLKFKIYIFFDLAVSLQYIPYTLGPRETFALETTRMSITEWLK